MRYTGFPDAVKDIVEARSGGWCEVCTAGRAAVQLHHRRPRASGGTRRTTTNLPANALAVCIDCHDHIESRRTNALAQGWLVPQCREPATTEVRYRGRMSYLDDAGNIRPTTEPAPGDI